MEGLQTMRDQLNTGATSETTQTWKTIHTIHAPFILTRRIWKDDYDDQMIFGDLVDLKFPDIRLIGEEKPRKNLIQETCPDRVRTRERCATGTHATASSTALDLVF